MPSLAAYPLLDKNRDEDARKEDGKVILLANVPLRMAQLLLHEWHVGGSVTGEQRAVMFMMLNERAARELHQRR